MVLQGPLVKMFIPEPLHDCPGNRYVWVGQNTQSVRGLCPEPELQSQDVDGEGTTLQPILHNVTALCVVQANCMMKDLRQTLVHCIFQEDVKVPSGQSPRMAAFVWAPRGGALSTAHVILLHPFVCGDC